MNPLLKDCLIAATRVIHHFAAAGHESLSLVLKRLTDINDACERGSFLALHLLMLAAFGKLALRGCALRILLLRALVIIVALLDGKLLGTLHVLAQIRVTLAHWWIRLAHLPRVPSASHASVTLLAPLVADLRVSVSLNDVIGDGLGHFLAAVGPYIVRRDQVRLI